MMLKVKHKEIPTKEQLIKQLKLAIGMLDDAAKLPTVGGKASMYNLTVLTSNEDSDVSIVRYNAVLMCDKKILLDDWYSEEANTILDRIADYEERDSERVIDYLNLKHVARRNGNLKLIKGGID